MEGRLANLLGSIISATTAYALARLEFAMRHPELPAPPLIDRLSPSRGTTLQVQWTRAEAQLDDARAFLSRNDDRRMKRAVYDASFSWLQRTTRELEQYARALRWVMTVEDER